MAHSKRLAKAQKAAGEPGTEYELAAAVALVKANATAKFDETVEISMNLGIDPRHADQAVRGVVQMPNGTGKTVRIGVFAKGEKAAEALAAGADVVGAEDLAEKVQAGEIDFDRCIATPDMMMLVGRLGKVLGPRGMMPNPKLGTVTVNVGEAVKAAKGGAVEFRAEKAGIIHAGIGKASFTEQALVENVQAFINSISPRKAHGRQGNLHSEGQPVVHDGPRREGGSADLAIRYHFGVKASPEEARRFFRALRVSGLGWKSPVRDCGRRHWAGLISCTRREFALDPTSLREWRWRPPCCFFSQSWNA